VQARLLEQRSDNSRHARALREAHDAVERAVLDHEVVDIRDRLVEVWV
jgi:hypothetical protein